MSLTGFPTLCLGRWAFACAAFLLWSLSPAALAEHRRAARSTDVSFQHIGRDQGLPNAITTAVAEDGQGFLWVGTPSGLARWDGYRFRVYQADAQLPGALSDNVVQALHGDARGNLWIGTNAGGLSRHDAATDRFITYPVGGERGISHVSVRHISGDGTDGLWVATDGGLDRLDLASGRVEHAGAPGGWAHEAGPNVRAVLRDRQGQLWLGSGRGLFRRAPGSQALIAVPLPGAAQPEALVQDQAGRIWVGTLRHGVFVLGDEGRATPRQLAESTPVDGVDLLRASQITSLLEVQVDEMWVATADQGVVVVELDAGATRRVRRLPAWPMSLADNSVNALYRDRGGLVWAASSDGLSRGDPVGAAVLNRFGIPAQAGGRPDALAGIEVGPMLALPDGRVWLGTHKHGVFLVDADGVRIAALAPDGANPDAALPHDLVLALAQAPDGTVFIATKRGLYRADADARRVRRVRRVHLQGRDPAASIWTLLVQGDTLWIGGQTDGLWRLGLSDGRSAPVRLPAPGLSDQRVSFLAAAPDGGLWVATRNGLNHLSADLGRLTQLMAGPQGSGLAGAFVSSVLTDDAGRTWVGSYGGGIDVLPVPGREAAGIVRLDIARGLPDSTINTLLRDHEGQVWTSTDNGLARIDPASMSVQVLRRADGVAFKTYWTGAGAVTADGVVMFGGSGGVTLVRPERLRGHDAPARVLLTGVRVGGQPLPGADQRLTVSPRANNLAVEFSSSDFSAPERNLYAYKLEGYDELWQQVDNNHRLAAYTNLPPGDYRLLLRASNRNGTWSAHALELPVSVLPAWYQTWWFRLSMISTLLGVMSLVVDLRTRYLQLRRRELEQKVRERTAELEAAHRALEQKSAQLELSSLTDPLTGLHNRRFLSEQIEPSLAASRRRAIEARGICDPLPDTDTVFLLFDVDAFKRVNDEHGHAAGDQVLIQFGARLRPELRESDFLVRWGGEEFLAVVRDTDRSRADELAERMRQAIAAAPFDIGGGRMLRVTCSIGFASMPFETEGPPQRSWQEVVALADAALYAGKRAGRDAWVGLHWDGAGRPPRISSNKPFAAVQRALPDIALAASEAG